MEQVAEARHHAGRGGRVVVEVEALWRETLGDELLPRPRLSRIYFGEL